MSELHLLPFGNRDGFFPIRFSELKFRNNKDICNNIYINIIMKYFTIKNIDFNGRAETYNKNEYALF